MPVSVSETVSPLLPGGRKGRAGRAPFLVGARGGRAHSASGPAGITQPLLAVMLAATGPVPSYTWNGLLLEEDGMGMGDQLAA